MLIVTMLCAASASWSIELYPSEQAVHITGLPYEQLITLSQLTELEIRDVFSLYVGEEFPLESDFAVYVMGKVEFSPGRVSFIPRYPLNPNQTYHVVFSLRPIGEPLLLEEGFTLSTLLMGNEPRVKHIYPSSAQLPANIKTIDVEFSEPMQTENPKQMVQFFDGDDVPITTLALLTKMQWNDAGTALRITLPGKVHNETGSSNQNTTNSVLNLVISGKLTNAQGVPLRKEVQKPFLLTGQDLDPPKPKEWILSRPKVRSRQALEVLFDEPLNYQSALEGIYIETELGERMRGQITIGSREEAWLFTPRRNWQSALYRLVIKSDVKDLAGNPINSEGEEISLPIRLRR